MEDDFDLDLIDQLIQESQQKPMLGLEPTQSGGDGDGLDLNQSVEFQPILQYPQNPFTGLEFNIEEPSAKRWQERNVVFTSFDPIATGNPEGFLKKLSESCTWVLAQLEKCKSTGRLHLQGVAYNKSAIAWKELNGTKTWKKRCVAPLAAITYCSKSDTKVAGPWEFGERPSWNIKGQKALIKKELNQKILSSEISELVAIGDLSWRDYEKAKRFKSLYQADAKIALQKQLPTDHVFKHEWIYGKTGTGKSWYARTTYPEHFIKPNNGWWDGYQGQATVIYEDLGKTDAVWIADSLKRWSDKYPFPANIKFGNGLILVERFIVTSNYHPRDLWEDTEGIVEPLLRRFKIIHKISSSVLGYKN